MWSLLCLLYLCCSGPETRQHRVSDVSALVSFLPFCGSSLEPCSLLSSERSPWGLVQGEQSGKQCRGARLKQDLQHRAAAVAWGCCPDWDAFHQDQSKSSEAVLSGEYNWSSKSPWSQLLSCKSCTLALRELPLGKLFSQPLILVRLGSGLLVISFTLYWLLLHCSKWLKGKG